MSDIYCPVCAEPFDRDELHDWPLGDGSVPTYAEHLAAFRAQGCVGIGMRHNDLPLLLDTASWEA